MSGPLTLALPKGRLLEPAHALLAGLGVRGLDEASRRLLVADEDRGLRFIFLKPADIPTYVEYGAADLGIVGKDILAEQEPDVYEPVDLGFGACRLVVAEPRALWERELAQMRNRIHGMRLQFVEKIRARVPGADFEFVARQRGMFSYSGLSKDAVRRLREEFSIYAVDSGRICVAALNSHNLDYVTEGVARVI